MYVSYCINATRYSIHSFLSQFNNCYSDNHWKCAKRVLRYLQGTKTYSLFFSKDESHLEGFVDADWASNKVDRKSYTDFVFKLSEGAVSWKSNKQKTISLSSCERSYISPTLTLRTDWEIRLY